MQSRLYLLGRLPRLTTMATKPAVRSVPPFARLAAVGLLLAACVGVLVGAKYVRRQSDSVPLLLCSAERGPFVHQVTVKGELESSANVDVACEVRSRNSAWIRILEVVPEGTRVQPGDFLVRLDSSQLERDRIRQQAVCEDVAALVAQVRSRLRTAEYNRDHYLQSDYALAHRDAEMAVFTAEEQVRQARQALEASRKLLAMGFITPKQFQADEFGLQRAETELRVAKRRRFVLENFTRARRLIELETAVVATRARLRSLEHVLKRNQELLADIEDQIRKCIIRAPVAGVVVLNHLYHNDHAHLVAPGELTMERRVLVRLPDPRHMQVKALVTEDKIAIVQPGVKATIELEAFPHVLLDGEVVRVNEYPEPDSFMASAVKKYQTIVRVNNPLPGMRPGLTAEVTFSLHQLGDVIQLPRQAVFKHGDADYCICVSGERWEARPIVLGPSNGKTVVVRSGLAQGESVILCPEAYRDKVELPPVVHGAAPQKGNSDTRLARAVPAS